MNMCGHTRLMFLKCGYFETRQTHKKQLWGHFVNDVKSESWQSVVPGLRNWSCWFNSFRANANTFVHRINWLVKKIKDRNRLQRVWFDHWKNEWPCLRWGKARRAIFREKPRDLFGNTSGAMVTVALALPRFADPRSGSENVPDVDEGSWNAIWQGSIWTQWRSC